MILYDFAWFLYDLMWFYVVFHVLSIIMITIIIIITIISIIILELGAHYLIIIINIFIMTIIIVIIIILIIIIIIIIIIMIPAVWTPNFSIQAGWAGRLAGQAVGRQAGTWGHFRRFSMAARTRTGNRRRYPPRNNTGQGK